MYHFLLTTVSMLGVSFENHIVSLGHTLFTDAMLKDVYTASFGQVSFESHTAHNVLSAGAVQIVCASRSDEQSKSTAMEILKNYFNHTSSTQYWQPEYSLLSCVLFDMDSNNLFLIGDAAGSLPLWFAFKRDQTKSIPDLVVSSDLLTISHLGFQHITPVGTGTTICISLSKRTILDMSHWTDAPLSSPPLDPSLDEASAFSLQLLTIAQETLPVFSSHSPMAHIVNELDSSDSSSLLLDCALSTIELHANSDQVDGAGPLNKRVQYHTQALVADYSNVNHFIEDYTICESMTPPVLLGRTVQGADCLSVVCLGRVYTALIRSLDASDKKPREPR